MRDILEQLEYCKDQERNSKGRHKRLWRAQYERISQETIDLLTDKEPRKKQESVEQLSFKF